MKMIFALILFIIVSGLSHAGTFQVSAKHLSDKTGNQYFVMQRWLGVEAKYQPDEKSLYYFASYDKGGLQTTYPAFEMSFTGLGFGAKAKVNDGIKLYGQLGYYFVDTSLKGRFTCANYSCGEGLYYGLNDQWAKLHSKGLVGFDEYEVETKNGYGVTFGAELTHKFSKRSSMTFGVEYRSLYVQTVISGMSKEKFGDYDVNGQRWESHFKGIDSINYTIGFEHKF